MEQRRKFSLISFDAVINKENGETEFCLKMKPKKKQVLVIL